ncbi:hemerythrin domain-containing protein [Jatrophihabitans sp. DSM 45814]
MPDNSAAPKTCDTSDMLVVHRVFRREFRLLPQLVRSVPPFEIRRSRIVADHAAELMDALHHHHAGEDELLWPKLADRVDLDPDLTERMEMEHKQIATLLDEVNRVLPEWKRTAAADARAEVAGLLGEVSAEVDNHLVDEERNVLPVVEQCITASEWKTLGERGMASIPKKRLPVFLGHILEEATPSERATYLGRVPIPGRVAYRLVGERRFRREVFELRAPLGSGPKLMPPPEQ